MQLPPKVFGISSWMADSLRTDRSGSFEPAILLVDMDSFFASVEVRDDPSLLGRPVLVGGDGRRGVVASCSYEARRFGIRSAMPMSTAKRLCPSAVVLPGDIARYASVSRQLHGILRDITPLVEPLGLDEAFLDVTGARGLLGSPFEMARMIRSAVAEELRLECGIGIGPSKLIAKLASRDAKPRITDGGVVDGLGIVVITPEEVVEYLSSMDVAALYGVGPTTAATLSRLGIERVADLAEIDPSILVRHLGSSHAHGLVALARGIDPRPVVADLVSKSIGHEETFLEDVAERPVLEQRLRRHAVAVSGALRDSARRGRTITVKIKMGDFTMRTRSHTMVSGLDDHVAIFEVGIALLGSLEVDEGVRLLGLTASNLEDSSQPTQLTLQMPGSVDGSEPVSATPAALQQGRAALEDAVAEIRDRFGPGSLGSAAMLTRRGVVVPAQRDVPFGPTDPDQASRAIQEP